MFVFEKRTKSLDTVRRIVKELRLMGEFFPYSVFISSISSTFLNSKGGNDLCPSIVFFFMLNQDTETNILNITEYIAKLCSQLQIFRLRNLSFEKFSNQITSNTSGLRQRVQFSMQKENNYEIQLLKIQNSYLPNYIN